MTLQDKIKGQINRFRTAIYGEDVREAYADIAETVCIESLKTVDKAAQHANDIAQDLENKRDDGFFKGDQGAVGPQGAQGVQGVKGDKGDKGDRGDSGITAIADGMYTLYVNESGNLVAQYPDTANPPPLSIDNAGNLVYTTGG